MADEDPAGGPVAPPERFREAAAVTDPGLREAFEREWPDCWAQAADLLEWDREYDEVLDAGEAPFYEWFVGGRLNAAANCVDRHLDDAGTRAAIKWVGSRGRTRTYTYRDLHREVSALAAGLREVGVEAGDPVTIHLPVVPELPVAMLACARIGAPHTVVFAGFSADALAARIEAADSEYLVTCDGYYHRGDAIGLGRRVDDARLRLEDDVEATVLVERLRDRDATDHPDHEHCYRDLVDEHRGTTVDPVPRDAEDALFLLYTSGTTGEPTGVTHTTGGYLAQVAWTARAVLDLGPGDTVWTAADVGWITGHSYAVYGPLALGATTVLCEEAPDALGYQRVRELIDYHGVDVFYTSPTTIRSLMRRDDGGGDYDRAPRLLGSVGEPIEPETWRWYRERVGDGEAPVVDTWWQTETGAIAIATLPGVDEMKPGAAGPPLPGIDAAVVDGDGDPVDCGDPGYLVLERPWPAMARTVYGDPDRFVREYWAQYSDPGADEWVYATGDSAVRDEDGYLRLLGRVDDVIPVADRRLRTADLESAVLDVDGIAEAAVVGVEDGDTAVYVYATPRRAAEVDEATLADRVREAVAGEAGDVDGGPEIVLAPDLPKTRSGKIMRRLLADVAEGSEYGDISALRNPEVVGELETTLHGE